MAKKNATGIKNPKSNSKIATVKMPADITFDPVDAVSIDAPTLESVDTTFNYDPITASTVTAGSVFADTLADRFMTAADYTMVDPAEIARQYGDIGRDQMRENAALSSELALQALDTELQGLQSFTPAAAALRREQIGLDNEFNQAQRDAQLAAVDPNIRADLMAQRDRANALASGRLPDSIMDRAMELGVRSSAADMANAGGFGAISGAGRLSSDMMSAQNRLGLMQYGDQLLNSNIGMRDQMLFAQLQQSDSGAQINVMPSVSGSQLAMQIAGQANDRLLLSPEAALTSLAQQNQFVTSEENAARKFNTGLAADRDLNQANLNLRAQETNAANTLQADIANQSATLQADIANTSNAISTQQFGMDIQARENEARFKMAFNVADANATRAQSAAQFNASQALTAAQSNQQTSTSIATANAGFANQAKQGALARAAAIEQTRISAAASVQSASIGASASMANTAATLAWQKEQYMMEAEARDKATGMFMDAAKKERDQKATADMITRTPTLINGIATTIGAINNLYDNGSTSNKPVTPTGSSDFLANDPNYNADTGFTFSYQ